MAATLATLATAVATVASEVVVVVVFSGHAAAMKSPFLMTYSQTRGSNSAVASVAQN